MFKSIFMKVKLKWVILICIAFAIGISLWFATNSGDSLKQQILEMQGKTINLNLKKADVYYNGRDTSYNNAEAVKLIVYVDSLSCSTCFLNNMMTYYGINDSLVKHGGHLIIILHPKRAKVDEIREKVIMDKYPFYCTVDSENEFLTTNNIPENRLLHAFMLDNKNKIILVGDPSRNSKIKELFIEQLFLK